MAVLVNGGIPNEWLGPLRRAGHELEIGPPDGFDHETLVGRAGEVDGLVSLLTDRVDAAVLEAGAAGRLRVVANVAVGFDNIDIDRARALEITVCNTPGVLDSATADVAMLLILAVSRRAFEAQEELRAGRWAGWELTGFLGLDLDGATLGLVGHGRIARAVERRAVAFGMRVLHHARTATGEPGYVDHLDDLLDEADVLSLHVPLTEQTKNLIGPRQLQRLKPGSVVVNAARGGVVDEEALADALESGHLGGAGLDVFVGEPSASPRLLAAPRLVVLPHIGSATVGTRRRMTELACHGVCEVLAGRVPANRVV